MPYLPIRCAWTHFAPSQETLALEYDPPGRGRLVSVRLEVRDEAGTLVYRSDPADCGGGPAPVSWTGALNQGNDANTEPFATPLRSPYKLKIDAVVEEDEEELRQPEEIPNTEPKAKVSCPMEEARREPLVVREPEVVRDPPATEVTVKVLYHSIEIVRGPWLATGVEPDRLSAASICHKLNKLGYHAGPPARAAAGTVDFLNKAKERFRRNHGDLRAIANPTAGEFEDALDDAIGHNTKRLAFVTHANAEIADGDVIPTGNTNPLRVYVEAIGFDEDLTVPTDEFSQQFPMDDRVARQSLDHDWSVHANKATSEARKLNRPLLPLEVVIYLKDHSNARVLAPRAVGAVRVNFQAIEPGEDIAHLPVDDSISCGTRTYFHRLFTSRYVDLEHDKNTNCPAAYGGIRTAANNHQNPFWREAQPYAPHAVPTDDGGAHALWVPAYTDWATTQSRVGRAGIYLHPSIIAGDRYKVRASLSFSGRGNQIALEQANPTRTYETKPIVVWRRVEIFAVVGWPLRDYGSLPDKCRERYARAFHELDFTATQFVPITDAIDDTDYADWFNHIRTHFKPSIARVVGILDTTHVHAECPAVVLPTVHPAGSQKDDIWAFVGSMFDETVQEANVPSAGGFLLRRIAAGLRAGHPCGGAIFLEYKLSDELRELIKDAGMGGIPTTSNGNNELMGIIDQAVDANRDYVFTHELAHCFWLMHHENAGGEIAPHHDQFDHNCMMSYPYWGNGEPKYAHHKPDRYDPTFCAKCNLKLRGWNITHRDILTLDKPKEPDNLTLLFYYDRADPGLHWDREVAMVRNAFTAVSRGPFRERNFDRNADFGTWLGELSDCDVYHHVTHGNVRCSSHKVRLASMNIAIPRYPSACRHEKKDVARLEVEEQTICSETAFNAEALTKWATKSFVAHDAFWHTLRSVIQWTVDDDDSSQDIEFTYEQVQRALRTPPRVLAFFSSCLVGWEKSFAKLFIDKGTPYVIAFRSRYETAQALEFADVFYGTWRRYEFDPEGIVPAFSLAAHARPHAEPVLFTKAEIVRAFATSMAPDSGEFHRLKWSDDKGFYAPLFPHR